MRRLRCEFERLTACSAIRRREALEQRSVAAVSGPCRGLKVVALLLISSGLRARHTE